MKILINTPRLIPHGGVANHYLGLQPYWSENVLYNPIGKKGTMPGSGLINLPINIIVFITKLIKYKPDIVLVNPSFYRSSLIRDRIFIKTSQFFRKPVSVFFHGFDKECVGHINKKRLVKCLNKCKCIFVLADEFSEFLQSIGVTVPIHITSTKVDDRMIEGFDIYERKVKHNSLLFLSRITKAKGIYIAIDAFKKLQDNYSDLKLRIVGNGPELISAQNYCLQYNIENVSFLGALSGQPLIDEFKMADIYLFPTFHSEGMPTSVLEAMAFGLPIISRPVGGLKDYFKNGEMGELIVSSSPDDYAKAIEKYLIDDNLRYQVSVNNHNYALTHFMASKVAKSIEEILRTYID